MPKKTPNADDARRLRVINQNRKALGKDPLADLPPDMDEDARRLRVINQNRKALGKEPLASLPS